MALQPDDFDNDRLSLVESVSTRHHHPVTDAQFLLRFLKHTSIHHPHLLDERGVASELWRFMRSDTQRGIGIPHGNGEPVLTIPGAASGDWILAPMNSYLRNIGYTPYPSGILLNVQPGENYMRRLSDVLKKIADETGQKVSIVGHSLGGSLGKILSDNHPEEVEKVVGVAAVFNSSIGINPLLFAALLPVFAYDLAAFGPSVLPREIKIFHELDEPAKVPVYSIYSKKDGILTFFSCIRGDSTNIKVDSTHIGMIWNEESMRALATVLRPEERPALKVVRHARV